MEINPNSEPENLPNRSSAWGASWETELSIRRELIKQTRGSLNYRYHISVLENLPTQISQSEGDVTGFNGARYICIFTPIKTDEKARQVVDIGWAN